MNSLVDAVHRVEQGGKFSIAEMENLLETDSAAVTGELFAAARRVRQAEIGDKVYLRGLVETSNICVRDCLYCGIRRSNFTVSRYAMPAEEIVAAARAAISFGYSAIVLQGGERSDEIFTRFITGVVRQIRELPGTPGITLSFGEQSKATYRRWFNAGATRYLLRIESSDPELYSRIHPVGSDLDARIKALQRLHETGYQVGTGVMIGLPGQNARMLAKDVEFFRRIDADMIGMGPFIPHPETPLGRQFPSRPGDNQQRLELSLRMIAITRLQLRDVNIAATTALQAIDPAHGRERGLQAGANVIMPNIGDTSRRQNYQLYEGKPGLDENADTVRKALEKSVAAAGCTIVYHEEGIPQHYLRRSAEKN